MNPPPRTLWPLARRIAGWLLAALGLGFVAWQLIKNAETLRGTTWPWGWQVIAAGLAICLGQVAVGGILAASLRLVVPEARNSGAVSTYLLSQALKYLPAGGLLNLSAQAVQLARAPAIDPLQSVIAVGAKELAVVAGAVTLWGICGSAWWLAPALPLVLAALLLRRRLVSILRLPIDLPANNGPIVWIALLSVAAWILFGDSLALIAASVTEMTASRAIHLAGVMAAGWLAGVLPMIVPAGLGVRESTLLVLLRGVVPDPWPMVLPLASRLVWTAADLVNFALVMFLRTRR